MSKGPWKHPRSPAERARRRREATRRAARKWWRKHAIEQAAKRAAARAAAAGAAAAIGEPGLRLCDRQTLDRPHLYYLDTNGVVHREEELPAEELIRRWKEAHEKK